MRAFAWHIVRVILFAATARAALAADAAAASSSLDSQLVALQQLVIKDEGGAAAPEDRVPPASRHVNALRGNVEAKDFRNALTQAKLIAGADPSPAVQKAIQALIPALQAAGEAQTAVVKEKLKVTLDQAANAVQTLKNPQDFDAVIKAISSARDQARAGVYGNGWDRQFAYTQLEAANRYLRDWQSYLIVEKSGNSQAIADKLRSLAEATGSFAPVPPSELLERAQKEAPLTPGMMAPSVANSKIELHSLDDLPVALNQLDQWRRTGGFNSQLSVLYNEMQNLQGAHRAFQDANYSMALQLLLNNYSMVVGGPAASGGNGDEAALEKQIAVLRNALKLAVVQSLLALPNLPPPQPDEKVADYLLGLAADKEKAEDWPALLQVLRVYQEIAGFGSGAWLQEDLTGLRAYLIGLKLEATGQHLDAIRSYRQSLATLGKFFPAEPPQKKLDDLRKEYPDLYQQALQDPINRGPRGVVMQDPADH